MSDMTGLFGCLRPESHPAAGSVCSAIRAQLHRPRRSNLKDVP